MQPLKSVRILFCSVSFLMSSSLFAGDVLFINLEYNNQQYQVHDIKKRSIANISHPKSVSNQNSDGYILEAVDANGVRVYSVSLPKVLSGHASMPPLGNGEHFEFEQVRLQKRFPFDNIKGRASKLNLLEINVSGSKVTSNVINSWDISDYINN